MSVNLRISRTVESKLGFSHLSIFSQSAERAARAAPNGVKKGATFLLLFRSLNHTDSSRKPFNGVQKGQVHSKKHKPSKKYFCGRSTQGSPPAGLKQILLVTTRVITAWPFVVSHWRGSLHFSLKPDPPRDHQSNNCVAFRSLSLAWKLALFS